VTGIGLVISRAEYDRLDLKVGDMVSIKIEKV